MKKKIRKILPIPIIENVIKYTLLTNFCKNTDCVYTVGIQFT